MTTSALYRGLVTHIDDADRPHVVIPRVSRSTVWGPLPSTVSGLEEGDICIVAGGLDGHASSYVIIGDCSPAPVGTGGGGGSTITIEEIQDVVDALAANLETIELGGSTMSALAALEGALAASLETISLDAGSLAALETIGLDAASLAALESITASLDSASLAALEAITVNRGTTLSPVAPVTVTNSPTLLLPANANRKAANFQNTGSEQIAMGPSSGGSPLTFAGAGFVLFPGDVWPDNASSAAWYGITPTATTGICRVMEVVA